MKSAVRASAAHRLLAPLSIAREAIELYLQLVKARLSALVVVTTAAGYLLAHPDPLDLPRLGWTLLGVALTAAGANGLNQRMEWRWDLQMNRTRHRPIPSGRLSASAAALWAGLSVGWGLLLLVTFVNPLTAGLALLVEILYLAVYTPLKRRSPLCTLVGAVCGAIPPVMGWTAATGSIGAGAWLLAGILFLWQIPHFLALAWLYRDDYARGGFVMLPSRDPAGNATALAATVYALALIPLGLAGVLAGVNGWIAAVGLVALGSWLTIRSASLLQTRSEGAAKQLFLATLAYLPVALALLVLDRPPQMASVSGPVVAQADTTEGDVTPGPSDPAAVGQRD